MAGRTKRKTGKGLKSNRGKARRLQANERAFAVLSALTVRADLAARMGKSYSGKRDLFEDLGYIKDPTFADFMAKYLRQDIAAAVINKPVSASWRRPPRITESQEKETKFELAWQELAKKSRVYHYFARVDRLASVGQYAVLLMGFDSQNGLNREVTSGKSLLYLMPYSESNASIKSYETDVKNSRFGLPKEYTIKIEAPGSASTSQAVHWSRVIHIAEDLLESNVKGLPRLEKILNRLQDLDLVAGGSAEMFWRGAFPGLGLKLEEGAAVGVQDEQNLTDEIEEYLHDLKRYLRLRGIDVKQLAPQVADPSNHVSVTIDLIAAASGIPKRILLGSERGELASTQDEKNWFEHVDQRRRNHCEPTILRPFIDRLIKVGVLPEPKEEYAVEWPDLMVPSDKEAAEVGEARSKALKNYVDGVGAEEVLPPSMFLRKIMGLTQDEINEVNRIIEGMLKQET